MHSQCIISAASSAVHSQCISVAPLVLHRNVSYPLKKTVLLNIEPQLLVKNPVWFFYREIMGNRIIIIS